MKMKISLGSLFGVATFIFLFSIAIALANTQNSQVPVITLNTANFTNTTNTTGNFSFQFTDRENATLSCDLYLNNTGYGNVAAAANNTIVTRTTNASPAEGNYTWTIGCTDNQTIIYPAANFTVRFDRTAPTISSTQPVTNNVFGSGVSSVWVNVTINEIGECRYANNTSVTTFGTMTTFGLSNNITQNVLNITGLSGGTRKDIYILCGDNALNNMSGTFNLGFNIEAVAGGGGGGGGGSPITVPLVAKGEPIAKPTVPPAVMPTQPPPRQDIGAQMAQVGEQIKQAVFNFIDSIKALLGLK